MNETWQICYSRYSSESRTSRAPTFLHLPISVLTYLPARTDLTTWDLGFGATSPLPVVTPRLLWPPVVWGPSPLWLWLALPQTMSTASWPSFSSEVGGIHGRKVSRIVRESQKKSTVTRRMMQTGTIPATVYSDDRPGSALRGRGQGGHTMGGDTDMVNQSQWLRFLETCCYMKEVHIFENKSTVQN